MELKIKKNVNIKNPTVILGFPGFGMISSIATEFLVDHLKAETVGEIICEELTPTIVFHNNRVIKPIEIFYAKKQNLVLFHGIIMPKGLEWLLADQVLAFAKKVKAKNIICLEGVFGAEGEHLFYYGDDSLKSKAEPLKESIITGFTAAMIAKNPGVTCLLAESHSQIPDSKAAARIISLLDSYLDLKVDPQPLLKQAEIFEQKLKGILEQANKAIMERDRKDLSYLG